MNAVVVTSFVFIFLSTAEFIYAKSTTALSPTTPVTLVGAQVTVPTAHVNDDKLHRYGVHVDDGKGGTVEVRFLLFKKPDGNIVAVGDACQDLRAGGFLYRQPGNYVQDVRVAAESCIDGAGGRMQSDSAEELDCERDRDDSGCGFEGAGSGV